MSLEVLPDYRSAFRSTLRHGERLSCVASVGADASHVLIHAPAWGATMMRLGIGALLIVSIHAPAWGATRCRRQARSPDFTVSIHAPAWGATPPKAVIRSAIDRFDPRSRMGSDWRRKAGIGDRAYEFRSTLPHGERPSPSGQRRWRRRSFDPRSRMGSDAGAQPCPDQHHGVSIHAPAWGATTRRNRKCARIARVFQSTLPHGERPAAPKSGRRRNKEFQSTLPAWGATFKAQR